MRGWRRYCGGSIVHQLVLVAVMGGLLAGCSSGNIRLADSPLFAGSNPAGPTALAPIESRDLPPAGVTPGSQLTTSANLKAQGYTVENAPIIEVGQADTAATLAQGFGVPVPLILEANGLQRPEDVRPGQRLVMPVKAPITAPTAAAQPAQALGAPTQALGAPAVPLNVQAAEGRHVVQPGETLWSISSAHRVSPDAVRSLNGLPADSTVKLGQTLRIPATGVAAAPQASQPTEIASLTAGTATDAAPERVVIDGALPQKTAPAAPAAPVVASVAPAAPVADSAAGFRWPVRGRIIAGFGKQADGARNDGINLAVPAGTPVRAAEAGTVIYAGNELEGYGNLILVQHADEWVSAYAHNETLKVNRGDKVTRGQHIASVGRSGSVDQPQLHFELRKKSKPVDPLPHLSGA